MISLLSVNFLAKLYIALMIVGISVVTARLLGPDIRGQLAIFINLINLLAMLLGISISDAIFHPKLEKYPIQDIFFNSLIIVLILSMLSFFPIFFYLKGENEVVKMLFSFLISTTIGLQILEGIIRSIATKKDLIIRQNYYAMLGRTIALAASIAICLTFRSAIGVVVSIMIGLLVSNGLSIYYLRVCEKQIFNFKYLNEIVKISLPIHLGLIGAALLSQADQVIIGFHSTTSQIAYYQIAMQVISLFLILPQSASNVIYNHVLKLDVTQRENLAFKFFGAGISIAVITILTVQIFAGTIVGVVFGEGYMQASLYLKQASWILIGSITMTIMGPFWVSTGYIRINSVFTFLISLIFVLSSSIFYKNVGISGVIYWLIFCYSSVTVFNAIFWARCSLKRLILRPT